MHNIIYKASMLLAVALTLPATICAENIATVKSPDGKLSLSVENNAGTVSYALTRGSKTIVEKSKVGLTTSIGDFSTGVAVKSVDTKDIESTFSLISGSENTVTDRCRQVSVNVEKGGHQAAIIFRIYNEGIAWRYTLAGSGNVSVTADAGEVILPAPEEYLSLPLSQGTRSSFTESSSALLECMGTASLPLIARDAAGYVIIGETAPVKDFCGSRLKVSDKDCYTYSLTENVSATLPLASPWRTVMSGSLADIASSHMIECLAEPASFTNTSWIKPGRAVNAYSGEDHKASYHDGSVVNSYIDWAAAQGWEYITIDKRSALSNSQIKEIVQYANSKNVGVFVWKSRASLPATEGGIRSELMAIKQAGAKGVKVEFWENESQAVVNQRNLLLSIAAEQQLMVLLSNAVNTAGLARTFPNLMGTELGITNTSYVFSPDLVGASHNINSAIMYAAGGPIDYSPVDFAERSGKLLQSTTHAHQLALAVAFRSGVQHIIDAPDNLRYSIAKNILKTLPSKWDETKWIEATHNESLMLMRRSGADYYLAALTVDPVNARIPLDFLPEGKSVNAYIYHDGSCPSDIRFEYRTGLTSASELYVAMAKNGGMLVRLADDDGSAKPFYSRYEAENPENTIPFGVSVLTDRDGLCSGNAYVAGAGFGRPITIHNISVPQAGTYALNVYYMASEASAGTVRLNGSLASIRGINFINSGSTSGRGLACATVTMKFDNTDDNRLEIASSTTLPSIDRITVTDNETLVYTEAGVEAVEVAGEDFCDIWADGRNIIIESAHDARYSVYNLLGVRLAEGEAAAGRSEIEIDNTGVVIVTVSTEASTQTEKLILR